jgi:glycerol-3-phosphate dehydrogenase
MTARLPSPAPPLNAALRAERLASLGDEVFDILIVGGGVTGTAIARDSAMRGLKTLLVEKGDLAVGTSSSSSKLAHGGLRYLEQGQLSLVYESVTERHRLRQLAPHLVRPIPFVFPVYEQKPRPLWMVNLGLWIYDAMAMFRSYKLHSRHNARSTAQLEPALRTDGLDGCVKYYDCMTDDARLTLENALGAHLSGATVLTYAEVRAFQMRRARVNGVELVDSLTGRSHTVSARCVINATGPWTDRTLGLRGNRSRILRPTKGVHIVLSRQRLPVNHAVVLPNGVDRRVVFAVPWGNRVMLGTTDTDFQGDFDDVHTTAEDVDYLLELTNAFMPDCRLRPEDVCGAYAGLRPLVSEEGDPSKISREHSIHEDEDGLITVAGGKLTTHRLMAAETLDLVATHFKKEGVRIGGCHTGSTPLPGGTGIAFRGAELVTTGVRLPVGFESDAEDHLGHDVVEHLQESYGKNWVHLASRAGESTELGERIIPDLPYLWAEVDHAVEHELTVTLRDFMRRRTQMEIRDFDQAVQVAPRVCERMAFLLGWSTSEASQQLASFQKQAEEHMAWREEAGTATIREG